MNPLVSPSWLFDRLGEKQTVILDATLPPVGVVPPPDVRANFLHMHIAGALFFDIEEFSDRSTSLPHMLPTADEFGRKMSALGVSNNDTIVLYEQADVFSAPRAWWMLRSMGAPGVYVLDGGLRSWVKEGLPTAAVPVHRSPADFHASLNLNAVKNFEQLQDIIQQRSQMLDARSAGRFNGTSPEPRPGIRSGHMPGAINVPYTELICAHRMKREEELRAIFEGKKLDLQQPVTTSCGSGVTAAVLALGLEICGATNVSLYDGSWAEYAQNPAVVIESLA